MVICWVRRARRAASSVGRPERFILGVGMQRLRATQHRRERLQVGDPHYVDVRLLGGERGAGRLNVEAQHQ